MQDSDNASRNAATQRAHGALWSTSAANFANLLIARLADLALTIADRTQNRSAGAGAKVCDRLDGRRGSAASSPDVEEYGEWERRRLLAKLDAIAASFEADQSEG